MAGQLLFFQLGPHLGLGQLARAWSQYQLSIPDWPRFRDQRTLQSRLGDTDQVVFWSGVLDAVHRGQIDTWDYSWQYAMFRAAGLAVLPNRNLVGNIGHDARGTHTRDPNNRFANLPTEPIDQIRHPVNVERHVAADRWTFDNLFQPVPVVAGLPRRPPWWQRILGKNPVSA